MDKPVLRGTNHYKVLDIPTSVSKSFESDKFNVTNSEPSSWIQEEIKDLTAYLEKVLFYEYIGKPNTSETRADVCKTIDEQLYAKLKGGKLNE